MEALPQTSVRRVAANAALTGPPRCCFCAKAHGVHPSKVRGVHRVATRPALRLRGNKTMATSMQQLLLRSNRDRPSTQAPPLRLDYLLRLD